MKIIRLVLAALLACASFIAQPADVASALKDWSTTAASNAPSGSTAIGTNLDDNLREIQAVVRQLAARHSGLASATTTDLGANTQAIIPITGTTTITGFGTVSDGIWKWVYFTGALTLTHNATSLILPTAANITTAAGDAALMLSLGSGNWRCLSYLRASGDSVLGGTTFSDGTVSSPGAKFTNDTDTGLYRSASNTVDVAAGGANVASFATNTTINPSGTLTLQSGASSNTTIQPASSSGTASNVLVTGGTNTGGLGGNVTITGGTGSTTSGTVNLVPGSTNGEVEVGGGASIGSLQYKAATGHFSFKSTDPVVTSGGGTGVAISGSDHSFRLTLGTTPGTTAIVVTFNTAYATNPPIAIAQYQNDHIALRAVTTTTTVTITPAATMSSGHIIDVIILGREN